MSITRNQGRGDRWRQSLSIRADDPKREAGGADECGKGWGGGLGWSSRLSSCSGQQGSRVRGWETGDPQEWACWAHSAPPTFPLCCLLGTQEFPPQLTAQLQTSCKGVST